MSTKPVYWREVALLLLLALLWGSSYLFIKVAVAEIPPFTLIALRVTIAATFLLMVINWRGEKLPRDAKTWKKLFVQSILNSIGAWTILAWGQQYVDSGLAGVLNSTAPIFIFFITFFFTRHEPVGAWKFLGACLGLLGVVLIVGVDVLNGLGDHVLGQLAALTGAILYAGAAIYGKKFAHLAPAVTAAGTMLWAVTCLVPLALIVDRPWTLEPSVQAIAAALILSVVCTAIPLQIYFRLVNTLGSLGVASQAYLRAGIGVFLGVIFLGEHITPSLGFGLLAAILGVVAINMPSRKAKVS